MKFFYSKLLNNEKSAFSWLCIFLDNLLSISILFFLHVYPRPIYLFFGFSWLRIIIYHMVSISCNNYSGLNLNRENILKDKINVDMSVIWNLNHLISVGGGGYYVSKKRDEIFLSYSDLFDIFYSSFINPVDISTTKYSSSTILH